MKNKGADQTARMHRLICDFVVRIWYKQVFSWRGSQLFLPAHKEEFNTMKAALKETVEEMMASVNATVKILKTSVESQMSQTVETVTKLKGT